MHEIQKGDEFEVVLNTLNRRRITQKTRVESHVCEQFLALKKEGC